MNEVTRLFDFFYLQLKNFPKADMLTGKVNGKWAPLSTQEVAKLVNRLSAGLLKLGLSGNDMTVENQDKVALISRNRPEWLILDLACQQIGIALCPIYPTTNPLELESIAIADNYSEAMHEIDTHQPGVILLDINLPDNKGIALLRRIKEYHPDLKVIVLTNKSGENYRSLCEQIGSDHFIDKSKDFENITSIIKSYVA